MARRNLLATRNGRLVTFGLLYLGEGLPQGFATAAVTLELRRMGVEAAELGAFSAAIMSPWAWKFAFGPVVDNLHLPRFGRRTQWVLAMQAGMIGSLVAAVAAFPTLQGGQVVGLAAFTTLLLVHNAFAACQDVAIDALAVGALPDDERGRANGLMFGAAQLGMAIGGSGVIAAKGWLGFSFASLIVPLVLAALMTMTLGWVREGLSPIEPGRGWARVGGELLDYVRTVLRVFFTTKPGFYGLVLALLPAGARGLSLTVSNAVTPALGMTDEEIATLGAVTSVAFAVACVAGGWLSDRLGRRLTLGLFASATVLPTLWLAWRFQAAGWLGLPAAAADGTWPRAEALIGAWVGANLVFSVFVGLMYGVRTALFMDVVEPRIAATQFTASMALLNVVTMYSYWWQGRALAPAAEGGWGLTLPQTLGVDSALGLVFLLVLPLLATRPAAARPPEVVAERVG